MRISDWSSDVCSSDLGEISLRHRLEDQFLRNALVVIAFKPSEQITLVREEKCALNFEPIGREPLEADRRIGAVGTGSKVLPDTRLRVEIRSDRPAVERLQDRKSTRLNSSHYCATR